MLSSGPETDGDGDDPEGDLWRALASFCRASADPADLAKSFGHRQRPARTATPARPREELPDDPPF